MSVKNMSKQLVNRAVVCFDIVQISEIAKNPVTWGVQ